MTLPDGSPKPMELIPDDPDNPSFLLLAYEVNNKDADRPLDTLGRVNWASDGAKTATLPDGRERQSVAFTSPPLKAARPPGDENLFGDAGRLPPRPGGEDRREAATTRRRSATS